MQQFVTRTEMQQFVTRKIDNYRPKPRIIYKDTLSSDSDVQEEFTANPADDIPRNRLVEKLVRGMQTYLERMQRREDFRIDVKKVRETSWVPAPRECATLTACGYKLYLIGGLNYDVITEVI